jgi:hypothetical protein
VLTGDVLDRPPDGPVDFVTSISAGVSNWFSAVGAVRIGLVLGAAVVIAAILAAGLRKPTPKEPTPTG